jgi:hypothetical protein
MNPALSPQLIQAQLKNPNIRVLGLKEHSKASEANVSVQLLFDKGYHWEGYIPYKDRRSGLFLTEPKEIGEYLESIYPLFEPSAQAGWVAEQKALASELFEKAEVTRPFFTDFLTLEWVRPGDGLPGSSNNPAKRIQVIKDLGFVIVGDTSRKDAAGKTVHYYRMLPIPRGYGLKYETMSAEFRKKAIKALRGIDAYENRLDNSLLPDHKFPEMRWDRATTQENPDTMSDGEIRTKFQLISNQRNQQKREVCRNCFQTEKRGTPFGIKYYYAGDENWPAEVPNVGAEAEQGCVGCGWYDLQAWRQALNAEVNKKTAPI